MLPYVYPHIFLFSLNLYQLNQLQFVSPSFPLSCDMQIKPNPSPPDIASSLSMTRLEDLKYPGLHVSLSMSLMESRSGTKQSGLPLITMVSVFRQSLHQIYKIIQ